MPTGEHCWKKIVAHRWLEPAIFGFQVQCALHYAASEDMWGVLTHCTVHRYSIATMLHVTAEPRDRRIACKFIKTENIAANDIRRIICSHILLHAQ